MLNNLDEQLNRSGQTAGARPNYCRFLRCKEMFIPTTREFDMASAGSGIFWCAHTQNCLGPDGHAAGHEHCVTGRTCHEDV